jgi:hypothetical protein
VTNKVLRKSAVLALLAYAWSAPIVLAADRTYLDMAGKLFGSVESPRLILDYCAKNSPNTATANARVYEEWSLQNRDFLDAVEIQIARADARLQRQDPPADAQSFEQIRTNLKTRLEQEMQVNSPEWIERFCSVYPKLIESKHEDARTTLRQLLATIEQADRELAAREQPNTAREPTQPGLAENEDDRKQQPVETYAAKGPNGLTMKLELFKPLAGFSSSGWLNSPKGVVADGTFGGSVKKPLQIVTKPDSVVLERDKRGDISAGRYFIENGVLNVCMLSPAPRAYRNVIEIAVPENYTLCAPMERKGD